ncbi:hypothetical protein NUACC21_42820 [Scytonema sp. NUACC21]
MSQFDNLLPEDAEYVLNLPYHLAMSGMADELCDLLIEFEFLENKIRFVGPEPLIEDYDFATNFHIQFSEETKLSFQLIQEAIRLSAHILSEDATQLAAQLLGRLMLHSSSINIQKLLKLAQKYQDTPWLRPLVANLIQPKRALRRILTGHTNSVYAVVISPDGKQAVSASDDKTLKIWNLATGEVEKTLTGHKYCIRTVAITPDGKLVVSASLDKTLKVWDLVQAREIYTLRGHTNSITAIAITPDGKQVVSASQDNTLKVWNLLTGQAIYNLKGHNKSVTAVAISASKDKTVRIWDLATGEEIYSLIGHNSLVYALTISPDGKQVISASWDKTLKVWNLITGKEIQTLTGHTGGVTAVAITPDGKQVVSTSLDKTLKIWNLATGNEICNLFGDSRFNCSAITPDGLTIVAGDCLGIVHFLRLEAMDKFLKSNLIKEQFL